MREDHVTASEEPDKETGYREHTMRERMVKR
jgi:hypothetical protein